MKALHLSVVCIIVSTLSISKADDSQYASVFYDAKTYELYIEEDYLDGAVAWGRFSNQVNKTGYVFVTVGPARQLNVLKEKSRIYILYGIVKWFNKFQITCTVFMY